MLWPRDVRVDKRFPACNTFIMGVLECGTVAAPRWIGGSVLMYSAFITALHTSAAQPTLFPTPEYFSTLDRCLVHVFEAMSSVVGSRLAACCRRALHIHLGFCLSVMLEKAVSEALRAMSPRSRANRFLQFS